jgi:hypothetical protein
MLEKILTEKKIPFDKVKLQMIKEGFKEAENWNCLGDIPKSKVFDILGRLHKKEKEASKT